MELTMGLSLGYFDVQLSSSNFPNPFFFLADSLPFYMIPIDPCLYTHTTDLVQITMADKRRFQLPVLLFFLNATLVVSMHYKSA